MVFIDHGMPVFKAMHRHTCCGRVVFLGRVIAAVLSWLLVYGFSTHLHIWVLLGQFHGVQDGIAVVGCQHLLHK